MKIINTNIILVTLSCITSVSFAQRENRGLDNHVLELTSWPDAVIIPHHQSINPVNAMTIEFWISTTNSVGRPITKRPGNGGAYTIDVNGNGTDPNCPGAHAHIFGSCSETGWGGDVICGWTHLAVTVDGTTGNSSTYINGDLIEENFVEPGCTIGQGTWDLMFGNTPGFSETQFTGRLDNVRIWQIALDQWAIQHWMNNDISPQDAQSLPELGGSWDFENGANDATGVNNGSLDGNASIVIDNFRENPINPVQWKIADGGNGHWYELIFPPISVSAEEHFVIAESMGGHTVTFASAAENDFCYKLSLNGLVGPIIGIRKQEGNNQGTWITGEPYNYTNWGSGEGNNSWERYAKIWINDNQTPQWQDTDLTGYPMSIVEWDADCNGDGIVDIGQILDGIYDDLDGNGVPDCCDTGNQCNLCAAADLSNDGQVNVQDILILIAFWGLCDACDADIDQDGSVNVVDLLVVIGNWGTCP